MSRHPKRALQKTLFEVDTPEEVDLALERGEDINGRDSVGDTSLIAAIRYKTESVASHLIERGASINLKGGNSRLPLIEAIWKKNQNLVELLVEEGADIEATDDQGYTALLRCLSSWPSASKLRMAQFLLEKGANIHAVSNNNKTALHIVCRNGLTDLIELLISKGLTSRSNVMAFSNMLRKEMTLDTFQTPATLRL